MRRLLLALFLSSCSTAKAPDPPQPTSPPVATTSAAPTPSATVTAIATAPAAPIASVSASAAPTAAPEAPVPNVKLANIGMHIGGGPNDDVTKEPIRKSVAPHFDEIKRCWAKVEDDKHPGDFGLDLLIPKDGGKASTSHVRTTLKGEGFVPCVVAVFEAIDFLKPKKGITKVSYSLRFTP